MALKSVIVTSGTEVVVSVSADGENFEDVAQWSADAPEDHFGILQREIVADIDEIEARWVRIRAKNHGTIPDGHPGKGADAYLFVDELLIE